MLRVLIIERDEAAAARLRQPLVRAGWEVRVLDSVAEARPVLFDSDRVDVALVGVSLPNGDARDLCREVRAGGGPPLILVGDRGHEQSLIAGLQLGADDYVVEPVGTAELLARIGAALRRTAREHPVAAEPRQVGPLTINPATRTAAVEGQPVELTPREYALLLALVQRRGEVVTRADLLSLVWGPGWMGTSKVLDVQISGLRRKLAVTAAGRTLIRTVRGVGFMIDPGAE